MPVGVPADGSYVNISRNKLIEMAYKTIGLLEPGQVLDGDMLNDGIDYLSMIIRETDVSGKWRWTFEDAAHVPVVSGTYIYTQDNGLPTGIVDLLTASYRDANGTDIPLDIIKAEKYEAIQNKIQVGVPRQIYLTEHRDLSLRAMYVWPTIAEATVQSQIDGPYQCLRTHTADMTNEPVTGKNWKLFWERGGEGGASWVTGTEYTASPMIRLLYQRPLADFVTASDEQDFPMPWPRMLMYKLAFDLGDPYGIPLAERKLMIDKAKGAFNDIFRSVKAKSNTIHNKVQFF